MKRVLQRNPFLVGFLHVKIDRRVEVDFIDIVAPVTRGVGLIPLLWHHGSSLGVAKRKEMLWLGRWFL